MMTSVDNYDGDGDDDDKDDSNIHETPVVYNIIGNAYSHVKLYIIISIL